jgi:hypothetical protein
MAELYELDQTEWAKWLAKLPADVREIAERLPNNRLYRMKSTGQRVTIHSYSDGGTVCVDVTGKYNLIQFARRVFGIPVTDLEECSVPGEAEPVGEVLTSQDAVDQFIEEQIRAMHERGLKHNTERCPLCVTRH